MLKNLARKGLQAADDFFVAGARGAPASGTLMGVMFHSLCVDAGEGDGRALPRDQNVTVDEFRRFVDAVLEAGYTVVSPAQVDRGLDPDGRHAMITFDDGYFNNTLALDVLREFQVPATFFVSTDPVLEGKAFWWEAFGRRLTDAGVHGAARATEFRRLKTWTSERVDSYLKEQFGDSVMNPRGDFDRPFTADELRDFARSEWVHLGNHTCAHAILTHLSPSEIAKEIQGCQDALTRITGQSPIAIAYPNGNHSPAAVHASLAAGLRVGMTVRPHRNSLPLADEQSRMTLGRFWFRGGENARAQCRKFSARFVPSNTLKTLINSGYDSQH